MDRKVTYSKTTTPHSTVSSSQTHKVTLQPTTSSPNLPFANPSSSNFSPVFSLTSFTPILPIEATTSI
ncbi:3756_t:CDS:2 [Dentiscutata heterogama]|uniref:3756_t:CDS:1 n=1 Tax=Dentiscutata heterogama TaxID=1316150 RepID=A0ACA9JZM0_9GLOM|nr:3756_t:CDS:2 [Dentiscutata heterogama]